MISVAEQDGVVERTPSGHRVEVVPVVLEPHPNADSLSVVQVYGYTVCVKTQDWVGVQQAAYVPPDTMVPVLSESFSFLMNSGATLYGSDCIKVRGKHPGPLYYRVTAKKMRGIYSYGLLVPAPSGAQLGDNVAQQLGVLHFNPPDHGDISSESCGGPNLVTTKYDVESFHRYSSLFRCGELVVLTEKLHGANGRWVYHNGKMYCGSRTDWKIDSPTNQWWRALRATPQLERWLMNYPDCIAYGEVYGCVQSLRYGCANGEVRIGLFDLYRNGTWVPHAEARQMGDVLPWVPTVAVTNFSMDDVIAQADGPSLVPGSDHYREGIVVKPLEERTHPEIGRVQLKVISPTYLEKSK